MGHDTGADLIAMLPTSIPATGWTATGLRIGRMYAETVHVHDTKGAQHFREFIEVSFEGTKRKRRSPHETRYLEELTNAEHPRLLSEEASDYLADMKRRKMARTTQYSQKHHFRLLMLAAGDVSVARINSSHIREFWDVLRWWPADAGSAHKYRGMNDTEILECGKAANRAPRSDSTLNLAKTQITAFFNSLIRRHVIRVSPMVGFKDARKSLAKPSTRRPFQSEEIVKIFDESTFLPWARKTPHAWWGPMIGLYTGARVSEIAQLKVEDIVQDCGVWCFHIRVTEDEDGQFSQGVKGESAIRIVPIAQPLLDAGFLHFLEDARESGHARLFPQLKLGLLRGTEERNGTGYGGALCRLFSAYVKRHMPIEKGLAFHCFRHNLITGLGIKDVEPFVIASITGHTPEERGKVAKSFPVMDDYYMHIPAEIIRPKQVAALATYQPPVVLPRYERGQFEHCFGPKAKKYP